MLDSRLPLPNPTDVGALTLQCPRTRSRLAPLYQGIAQPARDLTLRSVWNSALPTAWLLQEHLRDVLTLQSDLRKDAVALRLCGMMSILNRVQEVAANLTEAERRLVQEVVAKPRDVALGTAAELAKRSGVHEATASRLARKLGYDSYADFRRAVGEEFIPRTDPAVRVRNTLKSARGDVLAELVGREIEALSALSDFITPKRLAAAADAITRARKIYLFAAGNAETLAVMLNRRLRRLALDVEILRGDARDIAEQVVGLEQADVLLAFAFRRQPRLYAPLLDHARAVGATSIVIAGSIGAALSPAADYLLSAPRSGERDKFQTLTVPMALCNALVIAIMQSDETGALHRLERLGGLIEEFERR